MVYFFIAILWILNVLIIVFILTFLKLKWTIYGTCRSHVYPKIWFLWNSVLNSSDTRIENQSYNTYFWKYHVFKIPKCTCIFYAFQKIVNKSSQHSFFLLENNVNGHNESIQVFAAAHILMCDQYFFSTVKKTGKMLNLGNLVGNVGICLWLRHDIHIKLCFWCMCIIINS